MVLAISTLVIKALKKNEIKLIKVLYIYYLIYFKKDKIWAIINFDSKVNAIISAYTAKLDLMIQKININTQKFGIFTLQIFEIVLANFWVKNKLEKARFI